MDYIDMTNTVTLGDCRELTKLIPDESIDFVLTDPPYAKEYLYLYEYLATDVARVMKPGASLITICGHVTLHSIFDMFEDAGTLRFRWPLCMFQRGPHAHLSMGVEVGWKPMLWFVKGKMPQNGIGRPKGWTNDYIDLPTTGEGITKANHKWEQSLAWADYYIERLSLPGMTVFDPMVGSGTVAISAKRQGRNFIAFDCDEKSAATANERLSLEDLGVCTYSER
jgi:site-specific DNA-methyltransferase (adenine-specific)